MGRYRWTGLVLITIVLIGGWFPYLAAASDVSIETASPETISYHVLTVDELFDMLESKDFMLVNVHVPYEGELPKTDLFIPFTEIDRHLNKLPADKGAKIVLYCKTDRMSGIAAARLAELGYTNVWDMKGGMIDWREKGYPLLNATF